MNATNPLNPPTMAERMEQRDKAMEGAVRGLLAISGGGAVALLAFTSAISANDNPYSSLTSMIMVGVLIFALGVVVAALVHPFRYQAFFALQAGDNDNYKKYRQWYLRLVFVSPAFFVTGCLWVGIGWLVCAS